MIQRDGHGNQFIVMADGTHVPLIASHVTIHVDTVFDDKIVPVVDALAIHRTAAAYWFAKFREAETTIADLRQQLTAKG